MIATFHLSLPCLDIKETKRFYSEDLGLSCGRETSTWLDVNLFNNQLTYVLVDKFKFDYPDYTFEKDVLPSFHFGVVLTADDWEKMHDRINYWSSETIITKTFLKEKNGEHVSFFVKDPNGYTIEFKTFIEEDEMFMM
ncbi:VOC family protein [Tenacibaculum pacificus]|uniref:VOC family protein n=1 Tax=Tenacibaculum TaxID=104267 RepID=UPI0022F3A235|nr:VOC family protein [Tenacibaculum pacificus]WBX73754.1 VOC family protein [Tenacibaculum pacificus]